MMSKRARAASLLLLLGSFPIAAQEPGLDAALQAPVDTAALLADGDLAYSRGDVIAAMNLFRRAADAGSAEGLTRLAWILDQSEDNVQAAALYREAAEQGSADGQFGLAEMYAKGEGVEKDLQEAARYFTMAAEGGHLGAMRVLVAAYSEGSLGLAADKEKSANWQARLNQTIAEKSRQAESRLKDEQ